MQEDINALSKEAVSFALATMKEVDKKDPASVAAVAELLKVTYSLFFSA
ncbi:hypothetical protein [Streptococcus hyointestinalis]|nr:hypothetical protein [Streptococcus hyointestinalis]